jgi:hypothetical protein
MPATFTATRPTVKSAVLVALAKSATKQIADVNLAPGLYAVDEVLTIRLRGTVKKAADTSYTPTADIPLLPTLALLLERAGFTRDASKALLVDCMTVALTTGDDATGAIGERLRDVEAAMASVREMTAALPKKTRSGATTCQVELTIVQPAAVTVAA